MAFSYVKYTGDGSTATFSVPFRYLERNHVTAKVNNVRVGMAWLSNGSVRLNSTPADGTEVVIRRNTPNTLPLVDFTDGATLTEKDLDLLAMQAIFVNQEASDLADELVEDLEQELDEDITLLRSSVKTLTKKSNESSANAADAVNTADEALAKANSAYAYVYEAGSQVSTDLAEVVLNADEAAASAALAASSATDALSYAASANEHRLAAEAALVLAEDAADRAAIAADFDPEDFYTRVQTDGLLSTLNLPLDQVTGLEAALSGKAGTSHSHTIAQVSGLQSALDSKLGAGATAAAATKLANARYIRLGGALSGQVLFDGTGPVTIDASFASGQNPSFNSVKVSGSGGVSFGGNDEITYNDSDNSYSFTSDGTVSGTIIRAGRYLDASGNDVVYDTRSVSSGDGLTGGGNLAANRTISLGTPSAITSTSTNSVTGSSHTHRLSSDSVLELISDAALGVKGSYALLRDDAVSGARTPGNTLGGSNLSYATCDGGTTSTTATGTWRLMGHTAGINLSHRTSLWLRIA